MSNPPLAWLLAALLGCAACSSTGTRDAHEHAPTYATAEEARSAIATELDQGDVDSALWAADRGREDHPQDALVLLLAAEAYVAGDHLGDAADSLSAAVDVAESGGVRVHALANLGFVHMRLGDAQRAANELGEALGSGLADPLLEGRVLRDLGSAHYALGEFEAARDAWRQLPEAQRREIDAVVGPGFFLVDELALGN